MLAIAGGIILGFLGIVAISRMTTAYEVRKMRKSLEPEAPPRDLNWPAIAVIVTVLTLIIVFGHSP